MRSALYVPGDSPAKLAKALGSAADELIVDLEDAVPPAGKAAARSAVAAWLAALPPGGPPVWVRVNPGAEGLADARAVASPNLAGLCLAKTETGAQIAAVRAAAGGGVPVVPLLESAAAVLAAPRLARSPGVVRLQLGEADLRADCGLEPGPDEYELLAIRTRVVLACAAARIEPPMAPVSTEYRDLAALRESTLALRRLGFRGRACIHPAQLAVVNEVFTPSAAELARAGDVVARFEAALASGSGVCTDADGRLVDEAVVRSARRVLAQRPVHWREDVP